jgi:hypothetical protein
MATNYNYPSAEDIETQAKYRPGVASNIFNVLTGGLAGQITGSTQRAQEAARARQALLQEEFGKRDEQRTLERQLMVNALQQGIEAPAGSTLEEKMADFRNKALRKTLAAAQGATEGIKSPIGPYQSPYQSDPAFQISAAQAQADLEKRRVELQQTEDIQRRNLFNQAKGFGINVGPESTAGEIQAAIESKRPTIQAGAYTEEAGKRAIGELQAFQQTGDYPMVSDVSSFSPARAIAEADIAKANYANRTKKYAFEEKYKVEQEALKGFMQELKSEKPDKDKLQSLYSQMPETSKDNEGFRVAAGVTRPMAKDERDALNSYVEGLGMAGSLAQSISALQGTGDLAKVSQKGFNGFKSWITGIKNKYGVEDARYAALNDVIQEFEAYVSGKRKTLFGASLTGNELRSAKMLFGDPESANFLPRALKLIDSAFKDDVIEKRFNRNAIFVDPATQREVQDARQNWFDTRDQFGFLSLGKKGKIGQVVPAGGTNVMDTIIDMDAQGREIK